MSIQAFKTKLNKNPTAIKFAETMQIIEDHYSFTPTTFSNGNLKNKVDENLGSCKLFAFSIIQKLTKSATLACFGEHYKSVLEDINGTSHQNIRNFMKTGFKGLSFENEALTLKT